MNDQELDRLVGRAASVTDAEIAGWTIAAPYSEMCEAILTMTDETMLATEPSPAGTTAAPTGGRMTRRWRRLVPLGAAAASIVAVATVVSLSRDDGGNKAWAAPLVEFAERSPLLLLDDPAWEVTRADEYGDDGEMTFTAGADTVELFWRTESLDSRVDERLDSGEERGSFPTPTGSATVIEVLPPPPPVNGAPMEYQRFVALWNLDGRLIEIEAAADDLDAFTALLARIVPVDVDTWLSAMPASVIQLADQPTVIADMLTGIPLPANFDGDALPDDDGVTDRYQLGARVVGAVSCAWIEQWLDATDDGDGATAHAAVDAMNTSQQWPIVQEMNATGAFGTVVRQHADAMANGSGVLVGGPSISESYGPALGCD